MHQKPQQLLNQQVVEESLHKLLVALKLHLIPYPGKLLLSDVEATHHSVVEH